MTHRTFFTADTHFGHQAVLGLRLGLARPFPNIDAHDEALIAAWNAAVRPGDTVWHLGDFCHRCTEDRARAIYGRLRGRKFLVRGNHDKIGQMLPWDGPVVDVTRVHVHDPETGMTQGIWLSHYAHRVWPRMHRGDIHFYGHSHGSLPGTAASTDVGVDVFGYRPVTLSEIRDRLTETSAA
ncbi:metallophosphoesterase [Methylobacterium sp. J-092]|uniref:metallophosphoesterase n=1 Tax=Methylobacterium sp. J-092 TaxID=2836667 RepID=UPI001FBB65A9|nr:metallophosphoesterase [Methylobacterium sp. J-092]MCJ2009589.1 metallophosphoesterase [Methylobacterium sp. J-092]